MQLHVLLNTQELGAYAGTDGQDHQLITLYCMWPSNLEFITPTIPLWTVITLQLLAQRY